MASLNVEYFERKLAGLQNTMDSIQTLSLWIVHHKSNHQQIVQLWIKQLRKSKSQDKLNLMYLCNDVLQNGRRKGATAYNESFKTVLLEAASLTRESSIRQSVDRIFNIWEERSVYDSDFITRLKGALVSAKVRPKVNTKVLAEFKPQKLIDSISSFKRLEDDVIFRQQQFSQLRVDVTSSETLKQLKDRQGGKKFSKEFDEATVKLEEFVKSLDKQLAERKKMVELVEQAEIFYSTQHSEAKIVANAYKNFGTRISNFKKRIDQYKKDLPDPDSPIPSPSEDAPSPGSTPPPDDEPDTREVEDMEISDEDEEGKAASNIVAVTPSKLTVTRTGTGIRPSHSHTGPASKRAKMSHKEKPTTDSAASASSAGAGANILELLQNVGVTDPSSLKNMNAAQLVSLLSKTESKSAAQGKESLDVKKSHPTKAESLDSTESGTATASTSILSQSSQKEKPGASGESSLDSRLREMMSNAPSLPQAVSGLFDSPVRKSPQESPAAAASTSNKSAPDGEAETSPPKTTVWPQKPVQHVPATVPPVPAQQDVSGDKTPEGGVTPEGGMTPPDDIGTPLHDEEGGATPVQDEEPAPDLLSRLINQTSTDGGRTGQSDLLSKLAGLVKLGKGGQAETQTVMSAGQGGTPQGAPISSVIPPHNQHAVPGSVQASGQLQQFRQSDKGMKGKSSSAPRSILKNANGPGVALPLGSPPGAPPRSILKNKNAPAVSRGSPVGAPPRGIMPLAGVVQPHGGVVDNGTRLKSPLGGGESVPQSPITGNGPQLQDMGRGGGMMPQRLSMGDNQFSTGSNKGVSVFPVGPPVSNAPLQGPRIPTVTDGKPDFRGQQQQVLNKEPMSTQRGPFGQSSVNHANEAGFGQGQPIQRIGEGGVGQGQPIQRLGEQNDLGAGRGQPIQRLGANTMAGQPIQRLGGGGFRGQNPERRQSIDVVQRDRPQQFDRDRSIDPGTLTAVNSGSQPSVPQGNPIARLEPRSEPGPSFGSRDAYYSPRPRQQLSPRPLGPRQAGHRQLGPRHHGPRQHGPRQFGFGPRSPPPRKPPPPPPYPPPPGAFRQRQPFQVRPRY